jgi:hypothetical protein
MKEEDLTAEQVVYVKYIDVHLNMTQLKDSVGRHKNPPQIRGN